MSGSDIVGLVGALGVGALGAALVQGVINARAATAQRQHETDLREQDRQHELRMSQLADARAVRDRRSNRLHDNLASMVEMALRLGERTNTLRLRPDLYDQPDTWLDAAVDKIVDLRALIVLDAETEPLMRAVDDASLAYRQFLLAIETRKDMIANRDLGLAEQTKQVADTGQRVIDLMNTVVSEARKAWAKAEAAL